jgi:hypothetical protein
MVDWDIVRAPGDEQQEYAGMVSAAVHVPSSSGDSKRGEKARRIGLFFELHFNAAVSLPMPSFGHSCHFGLGLFAPAPDA